MEIDEQLEQRATEIPADAVVKFLRGWLIFIGGLILISLGIGHLIYGKPVEGIEELAVGLIAWGLAIR
jgi:hypothetical protein